jgi:hypothetical protein
MTIQLRDPSSHDTRIPSNLPVEYCSQESTTLPHIKREGIEVNGLFEGNHLATAPERRDG